MGRRRASTPRRNGRRRSTGAPHKRLGCFGLPLRMERRRCGCTRCRLAGGSAPYRITGSFNPFDQNVGVPVRLLDLILAENEVDGRRIVVRYQTLVADGV